MFVAGGRSTIDMSSFSVFKSESELKMSYLGSFGDLMTDQQIYFLCNTRKYNLKIDHILFLILSPIWSHVNFKSQALMTLWSAFKDNNTKKMAAKNIQMKWES